MHFFPTFSGNLKVSYGLEYLLIRRLGTEDVGLLKFNCSFSYKVLRLETLVIDPSRFHLFRALRQYLLPDRQLDHRI
jgi:hypothetical protein